MTSRFLIGCVLWVFLMFPAFLTAQEPLDAETQKLWDAHTVVPKTDDIQELRAFLTYGQENWMQMNGRIQGEQTWNQFNTAKNKATFEAADRILELSKKYPKTEQKKETDSKPQTEIESFLAGPHDSDVDFAIKHKINAFYGLRDYDPQCEQKLKAFIKTLEKDPTKKELVFRAKSMLFDVRLNDIIFFEPNSDQQEKKYQEAFADQKTLWDEDAADEPFLNIYLEGLLRGGQKIEALERIARIKSGTLVKPALEYYRSLYEKYDPDNTNALKELDRQEILIAEDPLAAYKAKVAELKKSFVVKTDENSGYDVLYYFHLAEDIQQRADAQRLLLTTVRPFFAKSEGSTVRNFITTFDLMLDQLAIEGQKFEFEAILMDGKKINIKDYRGKIVVIDYWATWCGPCLGEIPELKTFYENRRKDDIELIGFSVDEDLDDLKAFLEKEKLPWPIASEALSKEKKLADSREKYKINAFPTTILIDQEGTVVRAGVGLHSIIRDFVKLNARSNAEKK